MLFTKKIRKIYKNTPKVYFQFIFLCYNTRIKEIGYGKISLDRIQIQGNSLGCRKNNMSYGQFIESHSSDEIEEVYKKYENILKERKNAKSKNN